MTLRDMQDPRVTQMLDSDRMRYNMARAQYGPTLVGRAMQFNDQQYSAWSASAASYRVKINQEQQQLAQAIYDRNVTHANDIQKQELDDKKISMTTARIEQLKDGLTQAESAMKSFSGVGGLLSTSLKNVSNSIEYLIIRLGRRLFQKALREAISFVKQFNADMIKIQQITGKSDSEMNDVRSSSLQQAKDLRTSVANVTSTRVALYRQGLSDKEVENYTDNIIKFSTVTGSKITTATKNLTAAIKTGLVSSMEEAMDVLVALGDSAATTAEEISKGMQKAAASAKVAGVSYEELTSMLTIATSKTQLSGTQAGTFFQTLFSRMNRVTKSGYYTDESGETTNINDVEAALKTVGISLRSGKDTFRSSFEVLRDVAKVWEGLNDLQKNNITYAMVGNRNANMFNALMDGMGENGGEELDKYLGLSENAKGETETKYEIAIKGIQAALDNLKSTFDSFIASLGDNNIITGFLDGVTNIIQGITNINNAGQSSITVITAIGAALSALLVKALAFKVLGSTGIGGLVSTVLMLVAGGSILSSLGNHGNEKFAPKENDVSYDKITDAYAEKYISKRDKSTKSIEYIENIIDKYNDKAELSAAENTNFADSISTLITLFPQLENVVDITSSSLSDYIDFVKEASKYSKEMQETDIDVLYNRTKQSMSERMAKIDSEMRAEQKRVVFSKDTFTQKGAGVGIDDVEWNKIPTLKYINEIKNSDLTSSASKFVQQLYDKKLITSGTYDLFVNYAKTNGEPTLQDAIDTVLNTFRNINTPEGLMTALELMQAGYSIPYEDQVKQLLSYLLNDDQLTYDFVSQYSSIDSLLQDRPWNTDKGREGLLKDLDTILDQVNNKNITDKYTKALQADTKNARREKIVEAFNDEWGAFLQYVTLGEEDLAPKIIDKYFEMYEDWETTDHTGEYGDLIKSNLDTYKYKLFSGSDTAFKYSVRLADGSAFGFDDLSEEGIQNALNKYALSGNPNGDIFKKYMPNGVLDYGAFIRDAINNVLSQDGEEVRAFQSISEVSSSNLRSHKDLGFIDEYKQLAMLLRSSNLDFTLFDEGSRTIGNLQQIISGDQHLQEMINDLKKNGTTYTTEQLLAYLMEKSLGGQSINDFVTSVFKDIRSLDDLRTVTNMDVSELGTNEKRIMAEHFGIDIQDIDSNIQIYYDVISDYVKNSLLNINSAIATQMQGYIDNFAEMNADELGDRKVTMEDMEASDGFKQLKQFADLLGLSYAINEGVVTVSGNAKTSTTNPLIATEPIYMSSEVANAAEKLRNSEDWKSTIANNPNTYTEAM